MAYLRPFRDFSLTLLSDKINVLLDGFVDKLLHLVSVLHVILMQFINVRLYHDYDYNCEVGITT